MNLILKYSITITLLILFNNNVSSQKNNYDTLRLLNGQQLIGSLKSLNLGKVSFDANDIGMVELKKTKINTIISKFKIFRIEMAYKDVYYSSIEAGSKPGTIRVYDNANNQFREISILMISSFVHFSDSIKRGTLEGNINVGYSYTKSSDVGRFNLDGRIKYMMKKMDLELQLNTINTQKAKTWNRDRENANLSAMWYLKKDFIAAAISNYQRNLELGILYRFQEGGIVGMKFLTSSQMQSYIFTGLVINQEYTSDSTFQNQFEIPLIFSYNLFRFSKPEINISTSFRAYGNLTDIGRFREDFDFKIMWKIISDLNLQLQFYNSFDNRSNKLKNSNVDYGTIISIGYKF